MISEYMFEDLFSLAGAGDYDIVGCRLKEINEDELLKNNFDSFVNQLANQRLRSVKNFNKEAIESVLVSALIGGVVEEPLEEILPWSSCTYLYRNDLVKANNIAFLSERVTYSEDLFFNLDAFRRADSCAITTTEYYFYLKKSPFYGAPLSRSCKQVRKVACIYVQQQKLIPKNSAKNFQYVCRKFVAVSN